MESDQQPFTLVAEVGEFGLIDRLKNVLGEPESEAVLQTIGDDAAVYRIGTGRVHVVTTDAMTEGVHFDRTYVPMRYLGWKAITTNVSDIAAMNAEPKYAIVALTLPNNISVEQLEALYAGMAEACDLYGLSVIGGDTTAGSKLSVTVTAIGEALEEEVVYRSGAQVGDLLCVTGDLGSAAAGLDVLAAGKKGFEAGGDGASSSDGAQPDLREFAYVVERQLYPKPRLDRVREWKEAGAQPTSMIDLSDGLGSDLHHICNRSDVGAIVEVGLLPIHVQTFLAAERFEKDAAAWALFGGEDYELLFTISEEDSSKLPEGTFAVVGQIESSADGVKLRDPEGNLTPLQMDGYKHF